MDESSIRVASLYLKKIANAASIGSNIAKLLANIGAAKDDMVNQSSTLDALNAAGEARRLTRSSGIQVRAMRPVLGESNGVTTVSQIQGIVASSAGGSYKTHITFSPKRGHQCTCPDWMQNGVTEGPCKHVLALGAAWQQNLTQTLDRIEDGLIGILEHVDA